MWSRICCRATALQSTLVDGLDLDQWRKAMRPNTKSCFLESPTNPTLDVLDIGAHRRDRASGRRAADRRQRVRDADLAKPAGARRRRRGVFGDQAHRRPGPLPRRRHPVVERLHRRSTSRHFMRQTGPSISPFNAWVLLKGLETLAIRVRAQTETRRRDRRCTGAASENLAADLSGPRRSSAGGDREEADARRLDAGRLRGEGRQGGGVPLSSTR